MSASRYEYLMNRQFGLDVMRWLDQPSPSGSNPNYSAKRTNIHVWRRTECLLRKRDRQTAHGSLQRSPSWFGFGREN